MEYLTSLFKHILFTDTCPENFTYEFEPGTFHTREHLNLQGRDFLEFYILHRKKNKILGHLFLHLKAQSVVSPYRASYGGIEIAQSLDLAVLWKFMNYIEENLRSKEIKNISITYPPLFYNLTAYSKLLDLHQKRDYKINLWETGAGIFISKAAFTSMLDHDEKRRLKKSKEQKFSFSKDDISELEHAYRFIQSCRNKKDQALSMSFSEISKLSASFPSRVFVFTLRNKSKEIVSASIALRISSSILYNFYAAHLEKYDKVSPLLLLLENLYKYCCTEGYDILDLGTSSINGQPNFSLLHFKERTGAVLSPKVGFTKDIT